MKQEPTRKTMHLPAATHAMLEQLRNMILQREGQPLALTELIARLAEHEMDRLAMDKQPAQQENQR
jgi:hypothetical protein